VLKDKLIGKGGNYY